MKSTFLAIAMLTGLFTNVIYAQVSNWQWAKGSTQSINVEERGSTTDLSNNVYYTGTFIYYSIAFDSIVISNPPGAANYYVVKYSSSGKALWAKSVVAKKRLLGSTLDCSGLSVSTDKYNNLFVLGSFLADTIEFDSLNRIIDTASYPKVFLVKYDSLGNVQWTKDVKEGYNISANSVTNDNLGNVYITGSSVYNLSYQYYTLNAQYNDQAEYSHYYLKKYSPSGILQWTRATTVDSPYLITGNCVAAAGNGYVFVTGVYSGDSVSFGTINLHNYSIRPQVVNAFIARYDSLGNISWAKSFGTSNTATQSFSDAADSLGNVYVTGMFEGSLNMGGVTLTNSIALSSSFIAKYDSFGNVQWAKTSTGTGNNFGYYTAVGENGNVYASGGFLSGTAQFDSIVLTEPAMSNGPMYLVTFDPNGNVLCAVALGSGGDDLNSVSVDHQGNVYVAGDFVGSLFIVGHDTLFGSSSHSSEFGFVAKYTCSSGSKAGIQNINTTSSITVYPNPSSSIFYFSGLASGNTIEIYDLLGQSIYSSTTDRDNFPVNLSGHQTGVYFYRVSDDGTTIQQGKIVLE